MKLKLLLNEIFVSNCRYFFDIYALQGSVATRLRCGGIFNNHCFTCLLLIRKWKNFENWSTFGEVCVSIFLFSGVKFLQDVVSHQKFLKSVDFYVVIQNF